ncbi:SMI1/KNR4 family protein [Aldersonia sp. NBC_00410]|uniref:SMI1/KNR4 family protein n=1 Tax=Aldersonia sp. NBC_00410 TaxID=2975954 RepID=UPI00224F98AF|nr:SMI1/KNR4 family protein [Aldersonia sp. NBC_00410]MCX5044831.1 SMI1/KNR4 family protein [Aldersonia sp. NBC_00410]MCX5046318.1 SMI1/KNR4 family protein [Aldersonia sp. NBC_00410]
MAKEQPPALVIEATACTSTGPDEQTPADDSYQTAITELTDAQRAWYEKERTDGIDSSWMLTSPEPPATDEAIHVAEQRLGVHFDQQYTQWLHHVNGWKSFSGATDLLPLDSIARDSLPAQGLQVYSESGELTPDRVGVDSFDDLIVIGGTEEGSNFIAIEAAPNPETASMPVYEFGHGDVTKYDDFKTFLQSEIDTLNQI